MNSFQKEEDSITISERILMDDEDNSAKNSSKFKLYLILRNYEIFSKI